MSEALKDGGPAYPVADPFAFRPGHEDVAKRLAHGMSLRDYFAAQASEDDIKYAMTFGGSWKDPGDRVLARYIHADAMLRARATGKDVNHE